MDAFNSHLPGAVRAARPRAATIVAFLMMLYGARAVALDLDETQAVSLFFERNLDLIAARYDLEQARARELVARAIPNPTVGLGVAELDATRNAGNNGTGPSIGFSVSELIETAGKRRLRMESSALGTQAAEDTLRNATRILVAAVRRSYYALLLAQMNTDLAQDGVDRYARIVELNELRLKHGDIASVDLARLRMEALKARAELVNAQAAQARACVDLANLLRWPEPPSSLHVHGDWPQPDGVYPEQPDALVEQALAARADMQAARTQAAQAEKDLHLARRMLVPDLTLSTGYSHDPNNTNRETGNIGVSAQIPLFYRNEGEIRKAEIDVDNARLQLDQVAQAIRAEVSTALNAWRSADAIARSFAGEALGQAETVREAAEFAYRKGQMSVLELIDAQRNYREVMLEYQTVLFNRTAAYIDLQAALSVEAK